MTAPRFVYAGDADKVFSLFPNASAILNSFRKHAASYLATFRQNEAAKQEKFFYLVLVDNLMDYPKSSSTIVLRTVKSERVAIDDLKLDEPSDALFLVIVQDRLGGYKTGTYVTSSDLKACKEEIKDLAPKEICGTCKSQVPPAQVVHHATCKTCMFCTPECRDKDSLCHNH